MNLRDYYLREELHKALAQGHKDPLRFQLEKMQDESLPIGLRCAIANKITPYYHPRLGIATPPKFVESDC